MLFKSVAAALEKSNQAFELDLHDQHIEELPKEIASLVRLETINLSGNQDLNLATALEVLAKLENLRKINLMDCDLETVPETIGELRALEYLHLDNNALAALPASIGHLKSLTNISADNNRISNLPDSFYGLPKLKFASFNNNKLTALSPKLKQMSAMITLHLRDNQFNDAAKAEIEANLPEKIFIYKL